MRPPAAIEWEHHRRERRVQAALEEISPTIRLRWILEIDTGEYSVGRGWPPKVESLVTLNYLTRRQQGLELAASYASYLKRMLVASLQPPPEEPPSHE